MKNLILISLLSVSLLSCKKDSKVEPISDVKTGNLKIEFNALKSNNADYKLRVNVKFYANNSSTTAIYNLDPKAYSFVLDTIVKADKIDLVIDSDIMFGRPSLVIKYNNTEIHNKTYAYHEMPLMILNKVL